MIAPREIGVNEISKGSINNKGPVTGGASSAMANRSHSTGKNWAANIVKPPRTSHFR